MTAPAIVLVGGLGTRLRPLVADVPKPMASVAGRPFLDFVLARLERQGVAHVILSIGYRGDVIQSHFGERFGGLSISYAPEETPLGTGGAIRRALERVHGADAFVLNGDTLFDVSLAELDTAFRQNQADAVIALRAVPDVGRYGAVRLDDATRIRRFAEKGATGPGLVNGGVYRVRGDMFRDPALPEAFSVERDFLERFCAERRFFGHVSDGYFVDVGVPDDYLQLCNQPAELHRCSGLEPLT